MIASKKHETPIKWQMIVHKIFHFHKLFQIITAIEHCDNMLRLQLFI